MRSRLISVFVFPSVFVFVFAFFVSAKQEYKAFTRRCISEACEPGGRLVFVFVFVSAKQENNIGGEQSRRRVGAEKQKRNLPDALPSISVFVSVFGSVAVFASKFVFVTVFVSAKGAYWRGWCRGA